MPHLFSDLPEKLRLALSQAADVFLVVVMIYIFQYIFNSQFSCSCEKEVHYFVIIYIGLIPVILFVILNLLKQTRTKFCGTCCCGICPRIFQLLGIALFWAGCVLLDGDLYVCMKTKRNDTQLKIPCKEHKTLEENSLITNYKNTSQLCGYVCIAVGFTGWWLIKNKKFVLFCIKCIKCEISPSCKCFEDCFCESKPYYKSHYEDLLTEEINKQLDETLQDIAKVRAKGICSKYSDSIRSSQLSKQTDETPVNVDDCWSAISQPDFYEQLLSQNLRPVAQNQLGVLPRSLHV